MALPTGVRVLLIFGTSHVGKTTLAKKVAAARSWDHVSTDALARFPGRPWPTVRPAVAEYYTRLSAEAMYWFHTNHHRNMWPLVQSRIDRAVASGNGLVLEGSALRPEFLPGSFDERVAAIGLHASARWLRQRIEDNSDYASREAAEQAMIDAFIARSVRDDAAIIETAQEHGFALTDAADSDAIARLTQGLCAPFKASD
ncbi:MAG: hypothetical protein AAFR13_06350 [Pseudomonadota bacterium]